MASITTGLTQLMQIFYDKKFLERAEQEIRFDYGADRKSIPQNSGKTVYFNRFSTMTPATTPLTEATNPSGSDISSTIVSATVAEYGDFVKVGSLFNLTSIDEGLKEHTEVMSFQGALTVDTLLAAELSANSTTQLAGGNANITAVAATDVLSGSEIRKAVRTLSTNKAIKFAGGLYRGIIQPYTKYDLLGNSEWLDAYRYTDASNIRKGVVGQLHGVEFTESNNSTSQSSTTTVYHNYIFGAHSYGMVFAAGSEGKIMYVKQSGEQDTSNPLNMFSTIGWKITFAAKVLNPNWILNVKTGATA